MRLSQEQIEEIGKAVKSLYWSIDSPAAKEDYEQAREFALYIAFSMTGLGIMSYYERENEHKVP